LPHNNIIDEFTKENRGRRRNRGGGKGGSLAMS